MGQVDIQNEINRYCITPGQACSYKVGELKLWALRHYAEAQLGPSFDIKAFHDVVLGSGAVPLSLLDTLVRRWVAATRAA